MTDSEFQTQVMVITDTTDDSVVSANISAWWALALTASQGNPDLQVWYTVRTVALYLQARCRRSVNRTVGRNSVSARQEFQNATQLYKQAEEEIKKLDKYSAAPTLQTSKPAGGLPNSYTEFLDWLETGGLNWVQWKTGVIYGRGNVSLL